MPPGGPARLPRGGARDPAGGVGVNGKRAGHQKSGVEAPRPEGQFIPRARFFFLMSSQKQSTPRERRQQVRKMPVDRRNPKHPPPKKQKHAQAQVLKMLWMDELLHHFETMGSNRCVDVHQKRFPPQKKQNEHPSAKRASPTSYFAGVRRPGRSNSKQGARRRLWRDVCGALSGSLREVHGLQPATVQLGGL